MSFKKILTGLLILATTVVIGVGTAAIISREKFLREINTEELDVSKYITCTDEVSLSKAQVNWKNVASIVAVLNENKIQDVSVEEIKSIANLFLKEVGKEFKILPIEEVLNKLELKDKQIERVYNYLEDLEHYGLIVERLDPNEKYVKFIESIKEDAIKNYREYKVLPSITIAQAILESSWGESKLSSEYNNLFGIKTHTSWEGESVSIETKEFYDTMIVDEFRVYENIGASLEDHAKFLIENPRYKKVFKKKTYIEQAKALKEAGYSTATDEEGNLIYDDLLTSLIKQYNLQLIDSYVHEVS